MQLLRPNGFLSISLVSVRTNTYIVYMKCLQGVFAYIGNRGPFVAFYAAGMFISRGNFIPSPLISCRRLIKAYNNLVQQLAVPTTYSE